MSGPEGRPLNRPEGPPASGPEGGPLNGPGGEAARGNGAATSGGGVLVEFREMTRRYGELTAVEALSLEVRRGEMFGIIGPDGAGKTTALRVALGLLGPDEGLVRTMGLEPRHDRRALSAMVGYLSQRFSLYGDLSVDENIAFFAEVHGVPDWKPRREELLDMVRMKPFRRRLAERLSGGMKQKLALVCTLVHTPELLILDEPTTGVDPVSRRDFWKLLARLQREGLTLVMTTPYLDEAERCQRVALMHRGRLLAVDAPDALRRQFGGTMVEVIARPRRRAIDLLRATEQVTEVETYGERLHVALRPRGDQSPERAVARLRQGLEEADVRVELVREVTPSLEDILISRIRSDEARASIAEVSP